MSERQSLRQVAFSDCRQGWDFDRSLLDPNDTECATLAFPLGQCSPAANQPSAARDGSRHACTGDDRSSRAP